MARIEAALERAAEQLRMLRVPLEPILTVAEVAQRLGVSERTVRRYIDRGWLAVVDLPTEGAGRTVRVRAEDVRDFIESRRIEQKERGVRSAPRRDVSVPRLL